MSYSGVEPLQEFFDAIRNPITKDRYERRLGQFFKWLKIEGDLKQQSRSFAEQADKDPKWATYTINDYIRFQKERAEAGIISSATVAGYYKPIKLFCEQNDIILNFKKIARRLPTARTAAKDRIPKKEELKALLGYPDRRIKPIVLMMSSGGFRLGAWDYLHWGDIEPIKEKGNLLAAKVIIYRGENEEYFTFITTEAYNAVKEWMDFRAEHGEKVDSNSWVMRELWNVLEKKGAIIPKKLRSGGVKRLMERALWAQGVRKDKVKFRDQAGSHRHEFQENHGFRKFFKTTCERKMKTLYVEMLLGHNVGLNENYNRPDDWDLLRDYIKAVPELTILEQIPQVSEDVEELKERLAKTEERLKLIEEGDQDFEKNTGMSIADFMQAMKDYKSKKVRDHGN